MSKIAIVYWSGTGNTEKMAEYVLEGIQSTRNEGKLITASSFSSDMISEYDGIAFGCPSMGAEVLEESEFQPMWDDIETKLGNKKIALFGSYDWGDGEWIRNWEERCREIGANIICDFVICNLEPDEQAKEECIKLGKELC